MRDSVAAPQKCTRCVLFWVLENIFGYTLFLLVINPIWEDIKLGIDSGGAAVVAALILFPILAIFIIGNFIWGIFILRYKTSRKPKYIVTCFALLAVWLGTIGYSKFFVVNEFFDCSLPDPDRVGEVISIEEMRSKCAKHGQ